MNQFPRPPSPEWVTAHRLRPSLQSMNVRALGQGLVEYALILVLIAIVVIVMLSSLGQSTSSIFAEVSCTLAGGTYHKDQGGGNSNKCK